MLQVFHRDHRVPNLIFLALVLVLLPWVYVLRQGLRVWSDDNLSVRGVFGDSFGHLNTLYTGLAFWAAGVAVYYQMAEVRRGRAKDAADVVEARFFQMLGSLQAAVQTTRAGADEGRQAIRKMMEWLTVNRKGEREAILSKPAATGEERRAAVDRWCSSYFAGDRDPKGAEVKVRMSDVLGHLFRLTYTILRYVVDQTEKGTITKADGEFYVRTLRAHLSNPEMVLLFYNALSRHGHDKLYPLVEKTHLLHNIDIGSLADPNDATLYPSLAGDFEAYTQQTAADAIRLAAVVEPGTSSLTPSTTMSAMPSK